MEADVNQGYIFYNTAKEIGGTSFVEHIPKSKQDDNAQINELRLLCGYPSTAVYKSLKIFLKLRLNRLILCLPNNIRN